MKLILDKYMKHIFSMLIMFGFLLITGCSQFSPVNTAKPQKPDANMAVEVFFYDNHFAGNATHATDGLSGMLNTREQYITVNGSPVASISYSQPIIIYIPASTARIGVKYESSWLFGLISYWVDKEISPSFSNTNKYYVKIDSNTFGKGTDIEIVNQSTAEKDMEYRAATILSNAEPKYIN